MIRPLVCGALLGALSAAPAAAQGRSDLVLRGIQAYQSLDYRAAAELLRASLAPGVRPALPAAERSRALCYLGATEVFRSFRDSAAAVFRELVLGDPRYRPDALVFPPQVTDLFEAVRRSTPAFTVTLPADAELGAGGGRVTVRVVTSVAQPITVTVARADDRRSPVKTLFRGIVTDSVPITWDGTLGAGRAPGPAVGRYRLVVTSDSGPSPLEVEVPLEVSRATVDSLLDPAPPPAASGDSAAEVPIPMPRASGPPLGSLAVGLAAGAAAVALPAIVAPGARVTGARFVVGAALGVSAVVALFASRPHAAPPVEVAQAGDTSEGLRAEWQRQVDSVRALNARRRAEAPLVIHALPPVVLGSRGTTSP